jgi:hypothetical protein
LQGGKRARQKAVKSKVSEEDSKSSKVGFEKKDSIDDDDDDVKHDTTPVKGKGKGCPTRCEFYHESVSTCTMQIVE